MGGINVVPQLRGLGDLAQGAHRVHSGGAGGPQRGAKEGRLESGPPVRRDRSRQRRGPHCEVWSGVEQPDVVVAGYPGALLDRGMGLAGGVGHHLFESGAGAFAALVAGHHQRGVGG